MSRRASEFFAGVVLLVGAGLLPCAAAQPAARIVLMIGEDSYGTAQTLPAFASRELSPRGHEIRIVEADPVDKNDFRGLVAALRDADLVVVSVRRRTPHREQVDAVRAHVDAGRPLIGIRTASHAFVLRPANEKLPAALATWPDFGPAVLGAEYLSDLGVKGAVIAIADGAQRHPALRDVPVEKLVGHGGLYHFGPLNRTATALLVGTVPGRTPEPVAWVNRAGPRSARVFYTALGDREDFESPEFVRLLRNAVEWALAR